MTVKADDIKFDIAYVGSGYASEAMAFNIPWPEFVNAMINSKYSRKDVKAFPEFVSGRFKGEEGYTTSHKAADLIRNSMFVMNIVRCPVEKFERIRKMLEDGKSLRALGAKCLILSSEYHLMAHEKDAVPNARFRMVMSSARIVLPDKYKVIAKHLVTEIEKLLQVSIDPASWHSPSQAWRCQMHTHKGECYAFESGYETLFDPDSLR